MFVLKCVFICSGKKDIVVSNVEKGITLKIKEDAAVWHTFKIIKKTEELELQTSCSGSKLMIDFPFLRNRDYFVLEALGQCENLEIEPTHRIKDIPDIAKNTVIIKKSTIVNLILSVISLLIMVFLSILLFSMLSALGRVPTLYNANKEVILDDKIQDSIQFNDDSLMKVSQKDYSVFSLIYAGKTELYKISPDYYVSYNLDLEWTDIIVFLPLWISVFNTVTIIKIVAKYKQYGRMARLASKLLK